MSFTEDELNELFRSNPDLAAKNGRLKTVKAASTVSPRYNSANEMTEEQLLQSVIECAHLYGWLCYHQRPAKLANGEYRTALQGDKGFVDVVLAKNHAVYFWELKSEKGATTAEQTNWLTNLNLNARIVRPSDWLSGEILKIIQEVKTDGTK